ncbi:unnamed protein product, partial [Mesorhabditis belari]|uniref:Serpin domain-containing protein n=1 Tax=Mesorhabditis belari TaxID=2138241 RepID=A0AAF3FBD0_9BILA
MSLNFVTALLQQNSAKETSSAFSPLALGASLASIYSGSNGPTQQEFYDLFQLRSHQEVIRRFSAFVSETQAPNATVKIAMINKILVKNELEMKPEWESHVGKLFGVEVIKCDFEKENDVTKVMNQECSQKTSGIIKHIVAADNFSTQKNINVMLISGACFKGLWPRPFRPPVNRPFFGKSNQRSEPFLVKKVNVLMNFEDSSVDVAGISYRDSTYKLWIFLPKKGISLRSWIDSIDGESLNDLMIGALREKCCLEIPVFKIESYIRTKRNLQKLGLNQVFTGNADLSGISTSPTFISDATHKTVFEAK